MARRYSGEVEIHIVRWDDSLGTWVCRLSVKGEPSTAIRVGRAPADRNAVDSPEAHDSVAHAALSFADDDGWPVEEHAASKADGSGWHVSRSWENRHGKEGAK